MEEKKYYALTRGREKEISLFYEGRECYIAKEWRDAEEGVVIGVAAVCA